MKTLSIITATYNAERVLPGLMSGIEAAKESMSIQFIVVDGGSTDSTDMLVHAAGSVVDVFIREKDEGIYDAWNKGLAYVESDWVCFWGADERVNLDELARVVEVLGANEVGGGGFLYSRVRYVFENGAEKLLGLPWGVSKKLMRQEMCIPHPGVFYRASLFRDYGVFDKSFRIAGDYDFLLRLVVDGVEGRFLDVIPVNMLAGGVSTNMSSLSGVICETKRAKVRNHSGVFIFSWGWLPRAYIKLALLRVVPQKVFRVLMSIVSRCQGAK